MLVYQREGEPRTAYCKSCITLKNELKFGHKFPSCQSEVGILFIFSIYIVLQRKPRSVLDSEFETQTREETGLHIKKVV